MNIIKIGTKYVNLDQVTSITIKDENNITVQGSDGFYCDVNAPSHEIEKLQEILDNLSKFTKEHWED